MTQTHTPAQIQSAVEHVREQMRILTDPAREFGPSARVDVGARILIVADAIDALAVAVLELLAREG